MSTEETIQLHAAEIESLREALGVSLSAFVEEAEGRKRIFVADFDTSKPAGYAERYFSLTFALQKMFSLAVDVWEQQMLQDARYLGPLRPVSLDVFRATA